MLSNDRRVGFDSSQLGLRDASIRWRGEPRPSGGGGGGGNWVGRDGRREGV